MPKKKLGRRIVKRKRVVKKTRFKKTAKKNPRPVKRLTTKRIKTVESFVEEFGDDIKEGRKLVGETSFIALRKGAFRKLAPITNKVSKKSDFTKYTFDFEIRFTREDGKPEYRRESHLGIPKKKGRESFTITFSRILRGLVFRLLRQYFGAYPKNILRIIKAKGSDAAKKQINALKQQRKLAFKISLFREINRPRKAKRAKKKSVSRKRR